MFAREILSNRFYSVLYDMTTRRLEIVLKIQSSNNPVRFLTILYLRWRIISQRLN